MSSFSCGNSSITFFAAICRAEQSGVLTRTHCSPPYLASICTYFVTSYWPSFSIFYLCCWLVLASRFSHQCGHACLTTDTHHPSFPFWVHLEIHGQGTLNQVFELPDSAGSITFLPQQCLFSITAYYSGRLCTFVGPACPAKLDLPLTASLTLYLLVPAFNINLGTPSKQFSKCSSKYQVYLSRCCSIVIKSSTLPVCLHRVVGRRRVPISTSSNTAVVAFELLRP